MRPDYPGAVPSPGIPEDNGEMFDLRQYMGVILAHWWLILLILIVGVGLGAAYCVFATPIYRATCRYELVRESRLSLDKIDNRSTVAMLDQELNRQMVIMNSRPLHERVATALKPKWEGILLPGDYSPKIGLKRLRKAESMVDISIDAVDGAYALQYLQEMLSAYGDMRREELLESTEKALSNLKSEQMKLAHDLESAEAALLKFQLDNNIQFTEAKAHFDEKFLANLVQRENSLRMERTMLESQFDFLETASAATIRDVLSLTMETHESTSLGGDLASSSANGNSFGANNSKVQWAGENEWRNQETEVLRLQAKYDDELKTYKPSHPKLMKLKQEVDAAKRELRLTAEIALKRLKSRYDALKIQEKALEDAARTWRQELNLTAEQRAEYDNLRAKVEHLRKLYDQVYARVLDGTVLNVDSLFSRPVEKPHVGGQPVWPNRLKVMALAIVASLGLGVGVSFLLDYLDTSAIDIVAIEQRLSLPYLSGIPDWNRSLKSFHPNKSKIVVTRDKSDIATETYRSLRAALEHAMAEKKHYALLVTSSDENEGKSLTSLNLAIAFSWTGKRVLLVDGDLRRGALHRAFDLKTSKGLVDVLAGSVSDWREAAQKTPYENLTILPAGRFNHEVPELLSPSRLRSLLTEWQRDYDLILIDSAPAGRVVDTAMMARVCDGVMMVVRHGTTRFGDVRHALHRLPGANLLGFCLNDVDMRRNKGGYYYNHYYATGYYYGHGAYYAPKDASQG
jgi:capsular exopolysaccharide synthesis family protein